MIFAKRTMAKVVALKEGKPSDRELDELAGKIAAKWETLGIHLCISQDVVEGIAANAKDKPHQMLLHWRNTTTSATPYGDLYQALCHNRVGLNNVAREFCWGEEDSTDSMPDCNTDSSNECERQKAPIAAKRNDTTQGPVAKGAKSKEKGTVKLGTPDDDELEELGSDIGAAWRKLGRRLKVTEAELTAIHKENEELAEKGFKTLLHWKQSNAGGATYQVLYDALNHRLVGRSDLAKKYCVD